MLAFNGGPQAGRGGTEVSAQLLLVIAKPNKMCARFWLFKCLGWEVTAVLEYNDFIPETLFVLGLEPQKPEVQPGSIISTVIIRDTNELCQ